MGIALVLIVTASASVTTVAAGVASLATVLAPLAFRRGGGGEVATSVPVPVIVNVTGGGVGGFALGLNKVLDIHEGCFLLKHFRGEVVYIGSAWSKAKNVKIK